MADSFILGGKWIKRLSDQKLGGYTCKLFIVFVVVLEREA